MDRPEVPYTVGQQWVTIAEIHPLPRTTPGVKVTLAWEVIRWTATDERSADGEKLAVFYTSEGDAIEFAAER